MSENTLGVGSYYWAAIPRAFWSAWEWAIGQGLLLTILLALALLVCATAYALMRVLRRRHSWDHAMEEVGRALRDFLVAGLAASAVALLILFGIFFVRDAPTELGKLQTEVAGWKKAWEDQAQKDATELNKLRLTLSGAEIAYGVSVVKIEPSFDLKNSNDTLELRPVLKNNTSTAIRWRVSRYDLQVPSRQMTSTDRASSVAAGGDVMTFFPNIGLSMEQFKKLSRQTDVILECEILYGAAHIGIQRKHTTQFTVSIFKEVAGKTTTVNINWIVEEEKDEPIS